jgi:hypothetical protein
MTEFDFFVNKQQNDLFFSSQGESCVRCIF